MDTLFHISTENGQFYYTLFYKLSFLLGFLLFVYIGIRRKYPLHTWLLLGTLGSIFFIIGTKIGTYSWESWKIFFTNGYFEQTHSKSLIGGLLFGLVSILLAKRWFRFKASLIDAYALILPFALVFQRVGCLLAGCCFGTPTSLPWGVKYAAHFPIYEHHQNEGFINTLAESSLAVHPVPLYLMLVYLMVLFMVWKSMGRWKYQGSLALFSMSILLGLRFFVEFVRDSTTNHALGDFVFGLKEIQWILILLVVLFSSILFIRERYGFLAFKIASKNAKGLSAHALLVTILLFLVFLGKNWFTIPETIIMHSKLALVLLVFGIQVWKLRKQLQVKFKIASLAFLSFLLMSQTYKGETITNTDSTNNKTRILSFGMRLSDVNMVFNENKYQGTGCGRTLVSSKIIEVSPAVSTAFQYLQKNQKKRRRGRKGTKEIVFGAGLTYSSYNRKVNFGNSSNVTSFGANAFFGEDLKNFGYKFGASVGQFSAFTKISNNPFSISQNGDDFVSKEHIVNYLPYTEIRIGNEQLVYIKASAGGDIPFDLLTSRYKVGLGLGAHLFGLKNDSNILFGYAENIDYNSFFIDAHFAIGSRLYLQPGVRFGEYPVYSMVFGYRLK